MKVFISHKDKDSDAAIEIERILKERNIETYLDILDDSIEKDGEKLTNHLKEKIKVSTHIITVISKETTKSWWVPCEIGMAIQCNIPIVNFLLHNIELPGYLNYWPKLKAVNDVEKYITALKKTPRIVLEKGMFIENYTTNENYVENFYENLNNLL